MIRYENLRLRLRTRRKALNLSAAQAAQRARMNISALSTLELGRRENPTIQTLADWCTAMGGRLVIDVVFDEDADRSNCWLRNGSGVQTCICKETCEEQAMATTAEMQQQ